MSVSRSAVAAIAALVLVATASLVPGAGARAGRTVTLQIGDSVEIAGTPIQCFAAHSDGKDGIGCLLWGNGRPVIGSYSAGLAVDGSAAVSLINANGSTRVIRRGTQSARRAGSVYTLGVGDVFGIIVTDKIDLGCKVLDVTSTAYDPIYRGVKVSCWRATTVGALPFTWGISLSVKFAGVFKYDAHGNPTATGALRKQP
jgi:hypothetical protein